MTSTLGAPLGAFFGRNAGQSGLESRMSSLMSPVNACLPPTAGVLDVERLLQETLTMARSDIMIHAKRRGVSLILIALIPFIAHFAGACRSGVPAAIGGCFLRRFSHSA